MPLDFSQYGTPVDDAREDPGKIYARNKAWMNDDGKVLDDYDRAFSTHLDLGDEMKFKAWVKANNVPNDDGQHSDYDMRGFWKALEAKDPKATSAVDPNDNRLHYPDYWKTPYHETFSDQSKWADPAKAPKWNDKDQLVLGDKVLFDDRAQNRPNQEGEKPDFSKFGTPVADFSQHGTPHPDRIGGLLKDYEQGAHELSQGIGRVGEAAGRGYREGFEGVTPLLTPYAQGELDRTAAQGGVTGALAKAGSKAAEYAMVPLRVDVGALRGLQAGVAQVGEEAGAPGLGRDIAAIPEAFMGSPGMFRAPGAAPVAARGPRIEPGFGDQGTPRLPGPETPPSAPTEALPAPQRALAPPPEPAAPPSAPTTEGPAAPPELAPPAPPAPTAPTSPTPGAPPEGFSLEEATTPPPVEQPRPEVTAPPVEAPPASGGALKDVGDVRDSLAERPLPKGWDIGADPNSIGYNIYDGQDNIVAHSPTVRLLDALAAARKAQDALTEKPVEAFGGPWTPVLKKDGTPAANHLGEPLFENANGVRAIMDAGVPWTESVKETDGGLAPKNVQNRKRQHMIEGEEDWEKPAEPAKPGTADTAKTEPAVQTPKLAGEAEKAEKSRTKTDTDRPRSEWTLLGTNADGVEVFENAQGVHSTIKEGIRSVEPVRMRPTKSGMEMTVPEPSAKDPEYQVVTPEAEKPKPEAKLAPEPVKSSPTPKPASRPAVAPIAEELPRPTRRKAGSSAIPSVRETEELPAAEKSRREYDKYLTKPGEKEANKLAVDALNGDITEKEAVAGLGKLVRDGTIPEGVAQANLSRLTDWNEGEWEAAKAEPKSSELEEAGKTRGGSTILKPIREPAPVTPENPLVTHVTKKGKTLTGTIRTDLSQDEAKAIDPYSFKKNGGWFIRSQPTKSEPKAEPVSSPAQAAAQAGDVAPPDQKPVAPSDPALAEAQDLALGNGPAPAQSVPEPRGVYQARKRSEITQAEADEAVATVNEPFPEETDAVDRIIDMLAKGWSPADISETPGIEKSEREIRAIKAYLDGPDAPAWWTPRESRSGIQDPLRLGDEGGGPEGLQRTEPEREAGGASSGGVAESTPDAEGPAGGQTAKPRARVSGGRGGSRGSRKSNADRLPREGTEPGTAGRPDPEQVVSESKGQDFTIEPGDLGEDRGRMQKARDNVKAIELAKRLTAEKRAATVEEQRVLVKYVGWGGLKNVFRDGKGNFGQGMEKIGAQIEKLLTPEELRTASRSTQYAHYTAEHVIRSMWDAVQRLGFTGGSVFEPGMGIGHFRGLMPPEMAKKSQYRGVEMDHLTTDIAKLLYPNSGVAQADFTRMPLAEGAFDLVIGNPPFSSTVITSDPKYAANRFMLHDYFFAKSIDAVRPGGLLAFVTSAGTMNKMEPEAREYLARKGQFVGGVRLPSSAFRENAGTDVTTDILFFKRRPEGERDLADIPEEEKEWTKTAARTLLNDDGVPTEGVSNRYFADHPEMVLGEEGFFDKLYEGRYAVRQRPGTDLPTDLRVALSRLPEGVMDAPPTQMEQWQRDFDAPETKNGSYYVAKDGTLMQYANGQGTPVKRRGKSGGGMIADDYARVVKLVPVRNALRAVFKADLADDEPAGKMARAELAKHYDAFVKEFGPINKAEISFHRPTITQQEVARQEAREEARYVGDRWYEGDFDAEPFYQANANPGDIARARQAAREVAILAGKPFNEGSFDPDDLPDTVRDKRPNVKAFMKDPESYRLRSIEDYNDSTGTASKREIFYRNPISKYTEPELKSANDGLLWSLNSLGRFDAAAIAEKMGKTEDQIVSDLGDLVFEPPETPGVWLTRDDYLSGDVKTKLAQAQEAAQKNPRYQRNVDALEGAQPVPLGPGQITLVVGMPWIPMDVIKDFARDGLELGSPVIQYSPAISRWSVEPSTNRWRTDTAVGLPKWSTPRATAYELLEAALNRVQPRIYDTVRNGDSTTTVLNEKDTLAAQEKVAEIQKAFFDADLRSGWAIAEPKRSKIVTDAYNDALNREVLRQFNGDYLTTPGITGSWKWRPHQTRVISRIIMQGNTYMAHAVGAGKTSAMIGAGMEMKRLGLVRKPMYVVPNHMLGQFTKEFYEQYPAARIAVADDEQFHTDRRRQFMANVAADDLDAVIITHSSFKKVPVSDDFMRESIQDEIDELTDAMKDAEGDRFTVRRLEAMKERLEQKLSKPATDKDQTLNFEDMGVDFLFVDEAHGYRKLPFVTLQGNVKGIDPNGSDLARDLHMKVRYLESQRPGRSIVLASGTPVTNTMGELFSISRYLQPQAMSARGVATFDGWAQTFANTKTSLEQNPDGSYKAQTRLSQFVNMPELYKMVGSVMDIVTSEQLGQYVTRPKLRDGERTFNQVDPTPEQIAYSAALGRRMETIKNRTGPPQKGDDIILNVINDGRHAAIDPRFVSDAQGNTKSKLNKMLDNVVQIWKDSADTQFMDPASNYEKPSFKGPATQMIFANLGINQKNGFSTYDWIKEYLRRAGIPASEVAFIKDYKTSVAKQGLFNDMNEGKVRILVGSTQKMGTGVNAQRRLLAVHNLDPLWFPADDEQRNGRILRQGNHNPEIQIHDYATNGSYDSTMWQMMGRKAGFIEQFFRGDPNLRDMEDLGEASMYEQAAAMTTSDPRVMQLTQLRMDLKRLILRREGFRSNQWTLENKLEAHNRSAVWYDKRQAAAEQDIAERQDIAGKKFSGVVDGETYTDRAEFNKAIDAANDKYANTIKEAETKDIGTVGGFPIRLFRGRSTARPEIVFNGDREKQLEGNYALSAGAHLRNLETDRENYEANAAKERAAAAAIEPLLDAQFTGGDEIDRLDKAVKDLEAELKGPTDAEKNAMAAEEAPATLVNQAGGGIDLDEPRAINPPKLTGRVVDLPDDLEPD